MTAPRYLAEFEPIHACRELPTRHCPAVYNAVCGERPCARFEAKDEAPWLPEIEAGQTAKAERDGRQDDMTPSEIIRIDGRLTEQGAEAAKERFLAAQGKDTSRRYRPKRSRTNWADITLALVCGFTLGAAALLLALWKLGVVWL